MATVGSQIRSGTPGGATSNHRCGGTPPAISKKCGFDMMYTGVPGNRVHLQFASNCSYFTEKDDHSPLGFGVRYFQKNPYVRVLFGC